MIKKLLSLFLLFSATIEYAAESQNNIPYDIVPFNCSMKNELCSMIEDDMDMKMKLYATDLKKTYFSTDASKKEKILVCSMKEENHNPAIGSRYCGFIKYNQRSRGKSSSVDGCINGLAVHKNYRKQGIAQLLLSACENDYKNNSDLRQLQLTVFTSNRDAIKLYKKYGFSVAIEDCISVDMIKLI